MVKLKTAVMKKETPFHTVIDQLRRPVLKVALAGAAINLLMLVGPIYMLLVYDLVLPTGSVDVLMKLLFWVSLAMITLAFLYLLRAKLISKVQLDFDSAIADRVFRTWLEASVIKKSSAQNFMSDLDQVRQFISGPAILSILDLPWVPLFLAATFYIHPWLGGLTFLGATIALAATLLNWRLSQTAIARAQRLEEQEKRFRQSAKVNAEALRGHGMEAGVSHHWMQLRKRSNQATVMSRKFSDAIGAFSRSFRLFLQSALLSVGAYLAIIQEITPGMIIASTIIATRALSPLDQVIASWRVIGRGIESYQRLKANVETETLDAPDRISSINNTQGLRVIGVANADAVGSGNQAASHIVRNIDFELRPGEGLAIVGSSASGKTSLLRFLAGIAVPVKGQILLDEEPVIDARVHNRIGYLPQDVEMLPGTIAQNIAMFDPTATDKDIAGAAKIAGVHKLVLSLPLGYATVVGSGGQNLSGGQTQRIGLARSIYQRPKLLILDEPNSNLDRIGDAALINAIQQMLLAGTIVVAVAHRPGIVAQMDKILVMENGGITRFGKTSQIVRERPQKPQVAKKV